MYSKIILFLFGFFLGVVLLYRPASESFDISIPAAERYAVVEALIIAAEQLESGTDVQVVNEFIRTAIAAQPTSTHWVHELDSMLQGADTVQLKKIAERLKR